MFFTFKPLQTYNISLKYSPLTEVGGVTAIRQERQVRSAVTQPMRRGDQSKPIKCAALDGFIFLLLLFATDS